jgi:hypothetical protein
MKRINYKIIGTILVAGVLLTAIAFQIFGSGLVSTLPARPSRIITTQQGLVVAQTFSKVTVYHVVRILALSNIALLGLACILRGRPHEANG